MPAYIIVQIDVSDLDAYENYKTQVAPTVEKYGGEYVVRGGTQEVLEGTWPWPRCVVLKFPNMDAAKAWHGSAEYAGPKALRHAAATSNALLVEGV